MEQAMNGSEQLIQQTFFKFLSKFEFNTSELDYSILPKHIASLEALSEFGKSGTSIFDISKLEVAFYSGNFGQQLGYGREDYEASGYRFFEGKMHPRDKEKLAIDSISILKLFNQLSSDEKLNHKAIYEYRMLNKEGIYVRLIEQYQVLALDPKGQIWLMFSIVDVSPNQDGNEQIKSQLLNFRTGQFVTFETPALPEPELSKRELEILNLIKHGLLSKEISDKLSISVHTVNTHRQRILGRLGANNSMEAIIFASKYGLLD